MLSEKPWKAEAVLLLGAWLLFCSFAAISVGMGLNYFLPKLPLEQKRFYDFLAFTVGFHCMTLALVTPFLKFHLMRWRDFLGVNQPRVARKLLLGVAVGVLLVPVAIELNQLSFAFLKWLLHTTPEQQPTVKVLKATVSLWQRICFGTAAIIVAPIAEESMFRGILYPIIKQSGYPLTAIFATSLLFGLTHANLMTLMPLTVFAMVLIYLYEKTDTLLAPMIAHSIFNATNFSLIYLFPSQNQW